VNGRSLNDSLDSLPSITARATSFLSFLAFTMEQKACQEGQLLKIVLLHSVFAPASMTCQTWTKTFPRLFLGLRDQAFFQVLQNKVEQ
jgi:hypothetical protein